MAFKDYLGAVGTGVGMISDMFRQGNQYDQQKKLMELQMQNQMKLNLQNQKIQQENWDYTNYENQMKHIENAGLSAGLIYGGSGAGGAIMGGGAGGSASGGSAPQYGNMYALGIQASMNEAQIDLMKAQAEKERAQAKNLGADTTTVDAVRDVLVENMKQSGTSQWLDNIMKEIGMSEEPYKDWSKIVTNKIYGRAEAHGNSREATKFNNDLLKTIADTDKALSSAALDASQKILTDKKVDNYWKELMIAQQHADADMIKAAAMKLASEWATGELTNWKTWTDLGLKGADIISQLIGKGRGGGLLESVTETFADDYGKHSKTTKKYK